MASALKDAGDTGFLRLRVFAVLPARFAARIPWTRRAGCISFAGMSQQEKKYVTPVSLAVDAILVVLGDFEP